MHPEGHRSFGRRLLFSKVIGEADTLAKIELQPFIQYLNIVRASYVVQKRPHVAEMNSL